MTGLREKNLKIFNKDAYKACEAKNHDISINLFNVQCLLEAKLPHERMNKKLYQSKMK